MALIQTKEFDEILQDMLSRLSESYDKRQGSILYNLNAPISEEIALMYLVLEEFANTQFLDTAYGDYLTRLAFQQGIDRRPATASRREVFFMEVIPIGTRFSVIDMDINFVATESLGGGMYYVEAEQLGSFGNTVQGELLNIDFVSDFSGAVLGRVVIAGEDEESDDDLRARTITYVRSPSLNGNVSQYEKWAGEFEGIGSYKIEPTWNGLGTVRVSITDAYGNEASNELVEAFQNFLDPAPGGQGLGVAPIGATVTVDKIQAIAITITADVRLVTEGDIYLVEEEVRNQLEAYLSTEAFSDGSIKNYKVLTIIDRIGSIATVENVRVNGSTASLEIANGVPAILSEVTLNVVG